MPEDIQAADAANLLAGMAERLGNAPLDDVLGECVVALHRGFLENFDRAADAEGAAWPPRKDKKTHPLLQLAGALMAATQEGSPGNVTTIDGRTLTTGVDKSVRLGGIPGAAVHQFGYPSRNTPRRQYHYATGEILDECLEIVADGAVDKVFGS